MSSAGASDPGQPQALGSPDDDRGGVDVNEVVAKAERGSQVQATHQASGASHDEAARIEEIQDAEGATEGRVDGNPGESTATPHPGPLPEDIGSGGAQRIEGARISDRVAGGESVPDGPQ
jgi:hypothetical protein